jgi:aspartyl-tRNA synthetase
MFKYLGFTDEAKHNLTLNGCIPVWAPPQRFSFGLDRLVAILGGQETIRDFIAFPKK